MARDYTKYSLNGTGKYSKSKLALAIVEKFMEDSFEVTIEDIRESFPLPSKSKVSFHRWMRLKTLKDSMIKF